MRPIRSSVIVLAFLAVIDFCNAQDSKDLAEAAAVVQAFYNDHFAHDMGFSESSVSLKKNWLTPELYTMLMKEAGKPGDPDVVPPIDGDPFTDSQEYPTAYTIEKTAARSETCIEATISFTGLDHDVTVLLVKSDGGWLIDNIVYDNGDTLRGLLTRSNEE